MKLHAPYNRLKGAMREKGMTYADISDYLGISKATFCRKINGESDFYMSEAETLSTFLLIRKKNREIDIYRARTYTPIRLIL